MWMGHFCVEKIADFLQLSTTCQHEWDDFFAAPVDIFSGCQPAVLVLSRLFDPEVSSG